MQSNHLSLLTGTLTILFFSLVFLYFIPIYIEEPSFIPPFAMSSKAWPQTISILGLIMGVFLIVLSRKKTNSTLSQQESNIQSNKTSNIFVRFVIIIMSFIMFALAVPYIGFLLSSILLLSFIICSIDGSVNYFYAIIFSIFFNVIVFMVFKELINVQFPVGQIFKM